MLDAIDGRDMGVAERSQDLGFASKPREGFGIVRHRVGQDPNRDLAFQSPVAGAMGTFVV